MKIILELHGEKYTYESEQNDYTADEVIEIFTRMLVMAAYPPSVIIPAEGGHFKCEYVENNK